MPEEGKALDRFRVLLTRQSGLNNNLVVSLEASGASIAEVPVLSVSEAESQDAAANIVSKGPDFTDIIFVSRNAVTHGLSRARVLPGFEKARVLAVGGATASELTARGIAVTTPESGSGSEALMALPTLSNWSGRSVLIVRGLTGREWLGEELERRGAKVKYLAAYQLSTPVDGARDLARTMREFRPNVLFIHSRAALDSILNMSDEAGVSLLEIPMVAGAEPIREAALAIGWLSPVRVAASPGDVDMLAVLGSLM